MQTSSSSRERCSSDGGRRRLKMAWRRAGDRGGAEPAVQSRHGAGSSSRQPTHSLVTGRAQRSSVWDSRPHHGDKCAREARLQCSILRALLRI
eukprot:383143-Hanusia_phi.AAC.1